MRLDSIAANIWPSECMPFAYGFWLCVLRMDFCIGSSIPERFIHFPTEFWVECLTAMCNNSNKEHCFRTNLPYHKTFRHTSAFSTDLFIFGCETYFSTVRNHCYHLFSVGVCRHAASILLYSNCMHTKRFPVVLDSNMSRSSTFLRIFLLRFGQFADSYFSFGSIGQN